VRAGSPRVHRPGTAGHGATISQLALAWLLAQGDDIVVIPGTRSAKRVEETRPQPTSI